MAIRSGFFNSINGDRKYNANRFAEYFATFIGNGVFPNPSDNLQVMANNDMTVAVKAGKAWINGYILINDDDYILNIEPADGVLNRIDRIVARYDVVDREIALQVKQGDYATETVAPELQRDADAYELALADVLINNGATEITQANITDNRLNDELCGIVHGVVDQVDTTTLFNQYQSWLAQQRDYYEENIENWTADQQADFLAWRQAETNDFNIWQANEKADFEDWVDSIQGILDENAAGNLQLQISDLQDYTDGVVEDLDEHKAEKATETKLGHVMIGEGLEVTEDGLLSATEYDIATTTTDGLMSSQDKTKMDNEVMVKSSMPGEYVQLSHISSGYNYGTVMRELIGVTLEGGLHGRVRVSFELHGGNARATRYGRIYVNDSPVGIERSRTGADFRITFTEDIDVNPFDKIAVYGRTSIQGSSTRVYVSNLEIKTNNPSNFYNGYNKQYS